MLIPKSSRVSFRISPGWTGDSLLVLFGDFDVLGMSGTPSKADSILIIDPDAVLSFPVASQSLQLIAGRNP